MKTNERLQNYYNFDEAIVQTIADVAEKQNKLSFRELAASHGLEDGAGRAYPYKDNRAIEVIHIKPEVDYDETLLRVCQAPMGITADASMAMRAIRLFDSEPTTPLLVVGSPTGIGNRTNLIERRDWAVFARGDLRPVVRPTLQYLFSLGISRTEMVGYSYGADAGAAVGAASYEYGIHTNKAVLMEPAGIEKRALLTLVRDFQASGAALQNYVDQTMCPPLLEARGIHNSKVSDTVGFLRWTGGLLRASNIAIAHGLAEGKFEDQLSTAMIANPAMKATVVWGTASELTSPAAANKSISNLKSSFTRSRIESMEMAGMHHGGGDDIDLHAAMVLQGLRLAH